MLTRNYRTLLVLLSFAGGGSPEEPTSIFAEIWKFTAQLRESRSGELEFWLYRYLTAVAPYSDDILSEVRGTSSRCGGYSLVQLGKFRCDDAQSRLGCRGAWRHQLVVFLILGWRNWCFYNAAK
jgi:hypothetical protein